ncbi:MAG TPA: bifunctional glycosyltransferase/class I SAM-dependent methyltransferase [Acidimicrobiia bacterium]|jgi:glycosyltransferase involved in cell wall biosynthesis
MKRIGILIVAYNAASTLAQVLDRIPREFVPRITEVLMCDDHSQDSTYLVGLGYQQQVRDLPLRVIRHPRNLGYGGNQKAGYRWAIEQGLDIVVLLHGDGQYAPEILPNIVEPLELDQCDAVLGSRMMEQGAARNGGMPLYKYVGNRILTRLENTVAGAELTEWHSGYRAYSVDALRSIPFEQNSNGFDFDTEIILELLEAQKRIVEIPIPTYYGDEICYVDGLKYAKDVSRKVLRYRAHKMGFGSGEMAFASRAYEPKLDPETSHGRVAAWLSDRPSSRVLDLGCSDGALSAELRGHGHEVTGVDVEEHAGVRDRVDAFVPADLEDGIPDAVGDGFDVIVAADVLEHVREPERLLADGADRLAPGGSIVASVPNFGHWYPRVRSTIGRFDYDRRGILDRGHLRFFTLSGFEHLVERTGFSVRRREFLTIPMEVANRGGSGENGGTGAASMRAFKRADRFGTQLRPELFAYQFLFELQPAGS